MVNNNALGDEIEKLQKVGEERKAKKESLRVLKDKSKRLKLQVNGY